MTSEGMRAVYDSGFVLGRGTAADFWALMRRWTGLKGDDEALTKRLLAGFVVRTWMIELVRKLREQGYVTGILSDQTDWLDILDRKHHFFDAFDRVFNSYYLGKSKQDPTLFAEIAADLGLPPSRILFIDDNAGNVERARSAGMQVILFVNKEQFTTELGKILSGEEW